MGKAAEDKQQSRGAQKPGWGASTKSLASANVSFRTFGDVEPKKPKKKNSIVNPGKLERKQNDRFFSDDSKKVLGPNETQKALLQDWLASQHSGKKHEADPRGEIAKWCLKHGKVCNSPYTTPVETSKISEIFASLDTNKSGYLDMLELLDAMKAVSGRAILSKSLVQAYLKQMDANGDGLLSMHEFTSYLASKYLLKPSHDAHPLMVEMDEALLELKQVKKTEKVANALLDRYEGGRKEYRKMESKLNQSVSVGQRIDQLFQGRGDIARGRAETISRALEPPYPSEKPYQKKFLSFHALRQRKLQQGMYSPDTRALTSRSTAHGGGTSGSPSPDVAEQGKRSMKQGSLKSQVRRMLIARAASADGRRSASPDARSKSGPAGMKRPSPDLTDAKAADTRQPRSSKSPSRSRSRTPSPERRRQGSPGRREHKVGSANVSQSTAGAADVTETLEEDQGSSREAAAVKFGNRSPVSRFCPSPPQCPRSAASPSPFRIQGSHEANENLSQPTTEDMTGFSAAVPECVDIPQAPDAAPMTMATAPKALTTATQIGGVLHFGSAPGPYNRHYFATDPDRRQRIRSACAGVGSLPWSLSSYHAASPRSANHISSAGPALQHIRNLQQTRLQPQPPQASRPRTSLPCNRQARTSDAVSGGRAIRARHHRDAQASVSAGRPRAHSSPGVSRSTRFQQMQNKSAVNPNDMQIPHNPNDQGSRPGTADSVEQSAFIDWGSSLMGESEIGVASRVTRIASISASMSSPTRRRASMDGMTREVSPSTAAMGKYPFMTVQEHLARQGFQAESLKDLEDFRKQNAAAYNRKRYMSAPASRRSSQHSRPSTPDTSRPSSRQNSRKRPSSSRTPSVASPATSRPGTASSAQGSAPGTPTHHKGEKLWDLLMHSEPDADEKLVTQVIHSSNRNQSTGEQRLKLAHKRVQSRSAMRKATAR